ncbi:ash family protein [Salmonella enterica]|nr:ash family protein [Salmonella enterica subsp. enterica serovar Sandiego]EMC1695202.1 ash family protein [Salmonella enterica]
MMFSCRQQKMCLIKMLTGCYFSPAATLLAVGRENPGNTKATTSASCAFFIVATLFATVRHFMAWCIGNGRTGGQHTARFMMHHATMSMVALAGPLSGGPGSFVSGFLTPVRAIASERENSGDSFMLITKEAAIMATTPTKKHPKSAIRHKDAIPQLSHDCRRRLGRAKILSFHLYIETLDGSRHLPYIPYIFSCIHDDIKDVDNELIALGLFDEAMGKKRRK